MKLYLSRIGLGVSEQAGRRAVASMVQAELIHVERPPGQGLLITILDLPKV